MEAPRGSTRRLFGRPHWPAILFLLLPTFSPRPCLAQSTGEAGAALPAESSPATSPRLHLRREVDREEIRSRGRSSLSRDVSGEYLLGRRGELVEIDLMPNRLDGFISRLGDGGSDNGVPLTFFFATSELAGQQLDFTTRQVHGDWFSFAGTIVRGSVASKAQAGYYLLRGRLSLHDAENGRVITREVSLPLSKESPGG